MNKKMNPFGIDERNKEIFMKICTFLYIATIYMMVGIILYRQIFLRQDSSQFNDIAMIMSVNVVLAIAAVLYFGGLSFKRVKVSVALGFFLLMVVLGTIVSGIKYGFSDLMLLFDKFLINAAIAAILISLWYGLAWLGKRREDKELND